MAHDRRYDSPQYINAFLAGLKDVTSADQGTFSISTITNNDLSQEAQTTNIQEIQEATIDSGVATPVDISAASSPKTGTRAPPPTPETIPLTVTSFEHLPPIEEVDDEYRKKNKSPGSQRGIRQYFHALSLGASQSTAENDAQITDYDKGKAKLEDVYHGQIEQIENIKNIRDHDLGGFAGNSVSQIDLGDITNQPKSNAQISATKASHGKVSQPLEGINKNNENQHPTRIDHMASEYSTNTEPFPELSQEHSFDNESSGSDDSSVNIIVDEPVTYESPKLQKSVVNISSSDNASISTGALSSRATDSFLKSEGFNTTKTATTGHGQSRESLVYFENWGTPAARDTEPARVRRIIIYNLPVTADLTLIQSLVYGGSIEEMSMTQSAHESVTAHVTFTSADTCDAYHNTYKLGLEFKHRGKRHVAVVVKSDQVNVVSSMLQTYLQCGATRVVKVDGADEDWSIRALHRLAEGDKACRKVESIVDSYRNDVRTLLFRFAKIADAVTFRGVLLRHYEWKDAEVQFGADPCERATGFHQE